MQSKPQRERIADQFAEGEHHCISREIGSLLSSDSFFEVKLGAVEVTAKGRSPVPVASDWVGGAIKKREKDSCRRN